MSDVDESLAALKKRVTDAERARMLAELQVGQARQQVEESSAYLQKNFGVSTLEEAKALIAEFKGRLTEKAEELTKAMDEFEEAQCLTS